MILPAPPPQDSLSALLARDAKGGRVAWAPYPVKASAPPVAEEPLLRWSRVVARRLDGRRAYRVWDASELLFPYPGLRPVYDATRALTVLSEALGGAREGVAAIATGPGLSRDDLGEPVWSRVLAAFPELSDDVRKTVADGAVKMRLSVQPNLVLRAADGTRLASGNIMLCPDRDALLEEIFVEAPAPEAARTPPELARRLVGARVVVGEETRRPVAAWVRALDPDGTLYLSVDRRLEDWGAAVAGLREARAEEIAEDLARTMDLYWRPVGERWLLASTPGHPWKDMERLARHASARAGARFARALKPEGFIPENGVDVRRLGPAARAALSRLADCGQFPEAFRKEISGGKAVSLSFEVSGACGFAGPSGYGEITLRGG